ncbi:MAG: hypothetical protein LRS47_01230 [Desulfurococcales archaeon]|nr:hypothetical protein [Desulfurococcales archaeon]
MMLYVSLIDSAKQGLAQAVEEIITALPNIIAALIIIVVGVWIGKLIGSIVARIFSAQGFARKFSSTSVGRALEETGIGLPSLIGGLVYAFIAVISVAIGLQYLNVGATADYYIGLIASYLPRLMAGIIILTLGLVFAEIFTVYLSTIFSGMGRDDSVIKVFPELIRVALIVAVIVIGFDVMQLNQFNVIYWIVLGFFIIVLGIYLTDSLFDSLSDKIKEQPEVFAMTRIMLYLVFILVGLAAVFSNSPGVEGVLFRVSWGFAIGMGLLVPLIFYRLIRKEK